jgi:ketosteroid isomerase-like protein
MNSTATLTQWVAAINGHDIIALTALMAPHFVFVDALGNRVDGAGSMEIAWRGYFEMCPIIGFGSTTFMAEGHTILAAGEAGGTIDGESWRTPAPGR